MYDKLIESLEDLPAINDIEKFESIQNIIKEAKELKQKAKRKKELKRANGSGSIYKLSGRRKKPWIVRVTNGWEIIIDKKTGEETKKQKYQTIGYYETREKAKLALDSHRINPVSPKANITLKELYDEWSKTKYEYISRSTADNYKAGWKYLAKFQSIKFTELRSSHIQSIIDDCYKKSMSRSTMEKIKAVGTMLYTYAMQNDISNKNYAEFVTLPKVDKVEKEIFNDIEIKKMIDNVEKVPYIDTVLIMIYTGMRISEMLGLTKFNVDMKNKIITGGIKTDAGKNRVIPIHMKIYQYIKNWHDKSTGPLITNVKGKKMSDDYYRENYYYDALKALKIRELTPHCCRHTFASKMAKAGADTLYIQKIIGHSDYALTANEYTHTDIKELRKAISKI